MIKWAMCYVFGHQPFEYEYEQDDGVITTRYVECSRCKRRKSFDSRGWQ